MRVGCVLLALHYGLANKYRVLVTPIEPLNQEI